MLVKENVSNLRPAGYKYLLEKFNISALSHWHSSFITSTSVHYTKTANNYTQDIYPASYCPGSGVFENLEFALKYDGVNLYYLSIIFTMISETDLVNYINSKPIGKYARRIWFFYEFINSKTLPIKDLKTGNYTEALEPKLYYTINPGIKIQRQRIINNLLGTASFCPIVRKTDVLKKMELTNFYEQCKKITSSYSKILLKRALSYLYSKETKSSFEIEHIKATSSRTQKFIELLKIAEQKDFCDKSSLIELQNLIVDYRFKNNNYRDKQNYIGQTLSSLNELVHYVCPKPEDLTTLVQGLLSSHQLMKDGKVSSLVHCAVISYGFVFLHPFDDGNGRIHRFLIHNILAVQGLVPKDLMIPVSAVMLKNQEKYDSSLENYSKPLMKLVEYQLDNNGKMNVLNETINLYKYIDMTAQVEALFDFVSETIKVELTQELEFLLNYDKAKRGIQNIIDMPDQLIDLFIKFCQQNNGHLSDKKRKQHFNFLDQNELVLMEKLIKNINKLNKNKT